MSINVVCVHGHALQADTDASTLEQLCCPICGAVVKVSKDNDTWAGPLELTFVANSAGPNTLGGDTVISPLDTASLDSSKSLDPPEILDVPESEADSAGEPNSPENATKSIDSSEGHDINGLTHTQELSPEQIEEERDRMAAIAKDAKKSKKRSRKPPELPGINVIDELGRGGFGVVYRAFDEKHNREVALKTLQRMGPEGLVRFKNEFRALADIAHPNLASLYELVSDGRTWCFTMEILHGVDFMKYVWSEFESLKIDSSKQRVAEIVKESARLSLRRMNRLFDGLKQLVIGLNELHGIGKLHSDIKPSNVMVTMEGRVVLLDFGLISEIHRNKDGQYPTGHSRHAVLHGARAGGVSSADRSQRLVRRWRHALRSSDRPIAVSWHARKSDASQAIRGSDRTCQTTAGSASGAQ